MTRTLEGVLLAGAAALAALGVTLVNLARGEGVDAQVGLTFLTFVIALAAWHVAIRRFARNASADLLPPVALVLVFGLVEIYRLSTFRAGLQRWWLLIGTAVGVAVLAWLHRTGTVALRRYRNLLLGAAVGLLLLPMLPATGPLPVHGLEVNGSRLWIVVDLGFIDVNFQPGELAKVFFVVFLAAFLADRQPALAGARRRIGRLELPEPRLLVPVLLVWVASLGVLVAQRDLGASLLLFAVFIAMLYGATGESGYVVTGGILTLLGGAASWALFDHVRRRVEAWLFPFRDFEGAGYQIAQGLFGIGSGSLAGAGPGLGRPDLIPNAITDFVFAAVAEEFGVAGSIAVLAGYALVVAVAFGIALRARDRFRKLLALGLGVAFGIQTLLILGGVLRIVPLTGIALPFMSYGGSSLLGNSVLLALLLRVSHEERT